MANPNLENDFTTRLFSVVDGKAIYVQSSPLKRDLLDTNKCYLVDFGSEVYVWIGMNSSFAERKNGYIAAEDLIRSFPRPESNRLLPRPETKIIRVIEGFERIRFRFEFDMWLALSDVMVPEYSKGKVSGADVELLEAPLSEEDDKASVNCTELLKVWLLDGDAIHPLTGSVLKFYSGDSYIFSYTYPGQLGEEHVVATWFGLQSLKEDQILATTEARKMVESLKCLAVQVSMFEGNEPAMFFSIFKNVIVCKDLIATKGLPDDTYSEDGLALFRVQKTGSKNMIAIQVEAVATSLNSSYCYILQNGSSNFAWLGKSTNSEDHACVMSQLDLLKPNVQVSKELEGSESNFFWDIIGGRLEYPGQIVRREVQSEALLYTCNLRRGSYDHHTTTNIQTEVESFFLKCRILNRFIKIDKFDLDSLKTEEVFILDYERDIYVWVGQDSYNVDAMSIVEKYIEYRASLSMEADFNIPVPKDLSPVFIINEGSEPLFFRRLFARPLVKQAVRSMRSAIMSLETYVKGDGFKREVIDFALDRNLLKLFFEDQDVQNLEGMRKHVLNELKRIKSHLKQLRAGNDSDDPHYVSLAKEAMEFVRLKQQRET